MTLIVKKIALFNFALFRRARGAHNTRAAGRETREECLGTA